MGNWLFELFYSHRTKGNSEIEILTKLIGEAWDKAGYKKAVKTFAMIQVFWDDAVAFR